MYIVQGKEVKPLDGPAFAQLLAPYARVALDLGTGDGRYVYRQAGAHPDTFWIGVDAARENLAEYSARLGKKPSRGGRPNALYVLANVEALPPELDGVAHLVTVLFPWGSLLADLVLGRPTLLATLRRVARPGAELLLYLNANVYEEPVPREVRDLPPLTLDYVAATLIPACEAAGIAIKEAKLVGQAAMAAVPSMWARRLAYGKAPATIYVWGTMRDDG